MSAKLKVAQKSCLPFLPVLPSAWNGRLPRGSSNTVFFYYGQKMGHWWVFWQVTSLSKGLPWWPLWFRLGSACSSCRQILRPVVISSLFKRITFTGKNPHFFWNKICVGLALTNMLSALQFRSLLKVIPAPPLLDFEAFCCKHPVPSKIRYKCALKVVVFFTAI